MTLETRSVSASRDRIFGLDLLRTIAVLEVVYYHGTYLKTTGDHWWYRAFAQVGPNWIPVDGVTWFFVLSGFLIGRILLNAVIGQEFGMRSVVEFWWRRWFRTLPNYFLVLAALVVVSLQSPGTDPVWKYFLFSQNLAGWHPLFFPEAWSLAVEEWFYLLIPLVLFAATRLRYLDTQRRILICLIGIVVVEAAFRIWRVQTQGYMESRVWDLELRKQVVTRLDSLAFGVIGAYLSLFNPGLWRRSGIAFATAMILLFVHTRLDGLAFYDHYIELTLSPLVVLFMLPFLSTWHATGRFARAVTFISVISYSMYLLHLTAIQWTALPKLMAAMGQTCGACVTNPWVQYVLYWGITIGASWLLYRYFEKPTTALRDRWRFAAVRPSSAGPRSAGIAWAAATLAATALATGLVQVAVMQWRHLVDGSIIFQSRELLWMTPTGYLVVFALAAVPAVVLIAPLHFASAGNLAKRLFAALFIFLGALGLLLLFPRLHVAAQVVLALGIAVRVSGTLVRRSARSMSVAAVALAVVTVVLGTSAHWSRGARERRQLAALPAAAANAPNVLLIILDTVRAASLSLHGYERNTTPGLSRWASDGAIFEHAFAPAPWTFPSHASMFTGYTPSRLGIDWKTWETTMDSAVPTVAESFRDRGYVTAGFVANLYYTAWDSGLDRGFIHYKDHRTTLSQVLMSTMLVQTSLGASLKESRGARGIWNALKTFDLSVPRLLSNDPKHAELLSNEFLAWQKRLGNQPFFAFLNYFDAHEPYRVPSDHKGVFGTDSVPLDRYDNAIRYIDVELERVFSTLAERGVLDQTIVIVTSDHGELFGERGDYGHGQSLYTQLTWVPLVLRYPPVVPRGARVTDAVSLRDIPATLLELAGISDPRFPGRSFSWSWGTAKDGKTAPDPVISETTATPDSVTQGRITRSVALRDLHLIRWYNGLEELYNYRLDRAEVQSVRVDSTIATRVAAMRAAVLDTLPR